MAAKADGYIRIDTKINTKPADAGLAKLTGGLKAFASMVGVAFGIKAVVDFGKASVKAATELQNALIGLKSIADGTGQSFAAAQRITSLMAWYPLQTPLQLIKTFWHADMTPSRSKT